jgi:hypothetical protein
VRRIFFPEKLDELGSEDLNKRNNALGSDSSSPLDLDDISLHLRQLQRHVGARFTEFDSESHEARLRDVESQLDAIVGDDGKLSAAGYKVGVTQVVGSRRTGWGTFTGGSDRSGFDTTTADAKTIAEHFKALVEDLTAHGLIGS